MNVVTTFILPQWKNSGLAVPGLLHSFQKELEHRAAVAQHVLCGGV
jgi:hypothetical protein